MRELSINQDECNYLSLMKQILDEGEERIDRTGIGTKSIFGAQLRFSLKGRKLPLITTKKMFFKGVVEELLFFIRGETDTKKLEEKGVNIWKGNTSREFLDSRGLTYLKEGDMGKGYGYQWRKFGALDGTEAGSNDDYTGPGVDQLQQVIRSIKEEPFSRRHIITAWNPQQLDAIALPPCHCFMQFYVSAQKELSCQWYQRSTDVFLGLPFNIASYALLTHIIAQATGLIAKEVIVSMGDVHIYLNHVEAIKTQLSRQPYGQPHIYFHKEIKTVKDMEQLVFEDFELEEYSYYDAIKASMAI